MTFWPRFPISRKDSGNWVEVQDMLTLRPAPRTEFRGGSHCDSQIGWRGHICKIWPGCVTLNSKTPMKGDTLALDLGKKIGTWLAVGMRLGRACGGTKIR